jgi:hypothetical protein
MKTYDVFLAPSAAAGEDLQASLYVHHDGRKIWKNSQEWDSLFCDAGEKRMIEATVERYPDQERFMVGLCIVQRRMDQ